MGHQYTAKKFDLPTLEGLSEKQVEVHLGLYEGYVKNTNHLREQIADLSATDGDKYAYAIAELRRRLGFEFNGMRMHEYYFEQFEGGAQNPESESVFSKAVAEKYGSYEKFIEHFTTLGMTRGIGWTVLYQDPLKNGAEDGAGDAGGTVHTAWVGDHELGQLAGLPVILALDMWEHAFMVDYLPSEKKQYIEAFLKNVNWKVVEERVV